MANMSYCRFENTLADLHDCERAMCDEGDDLSTSELKARTKLIRLCVEIAKNFGPTPVSNALFALPTKSLEVHI